MNVLTTFDLFIFFGSLLLVMVAGLWAGRKEEDSADYFLAGRKARWWGVAGSIFGSNVSANHIVGMMGVGFSVGFAQSHFEISAIFGLLLLCFGFLPVYRKLKLYTLSEYLSKRYNDGSRVAYAIIMVIVIVIIQMVPGFYIGSRSLNILLQGDTGRKAVAEAVLSEAGAVTAIEIKHGGDKYGSVPEVILDPLPDGVKQPVFDVSLEDGVISKIDLEAPVSGFDVEKPPRVIFKGGNESNAEISPGDVDPKWYILGILVMALVTGTYTIVGGLKAVIVTDVLQSVLMLIGAFIVAYLTFSQPEIGGWGGMRAIDAAQEAGQQRMHLYRSASDPALPWTGVLSGLMILHFYYWGTNQFIVQRALAARTDREARLGIIVAGFFKLLIPFLSIGGGIAAFYLFKERNMEVAQDAAFTVLLKSVVAPVGYGIVGLVAAGLIGAILSSLDSMMNSGATIVTMDFYKRYVKPDASEQRLVFIGRIWITVFLAAAAFLCIFTMNPNSEGSFFLQIASHQSKLVAGVVVAFALGMFWKRATAAGALTAILSGVLFSYTLPPIYEITIGSEDAFFGPKLNFMHSVFAAAVLATILHVVISLMTQPDPEKSRMTWTELGGHDPQKVRKAGRYILGALVVFAVLGLLVAKETIPPVAGALIGALIAFSGFFLSALAAVAEAKADASGEDQAAAIWKEDRFWAGILCGTAVYMLYYFF